MESLVNCWATELNWTIPKIEKSVVQSLSRVWLFATAWTAACQASVSFTISWSLLKLISIESVMQSSHPLLPPSPPLLSLSQYQGVFQALCFKWPKYWSFSFSISPSSEYSGLISFRIDWMNLLAVQGTLKRLLHTTVWKHQFFGAQPSFWSNSHIRTWLLEKP